MRSNKKYKGKYTKKRLKNLVRGTIFLAGFRQSGRSLYPFEKQIAYAWYREGKITFEQFLQWGY